MKKLLFSSLICLVLVYIFQLSNNRRDPGAIDKAINGRMEAPLTTPDAGAQIAEAYGKFPLSFEANEGQSARQVRFLSRGSGYSLFLTSTEAVLALTRKNEKGTNATLRMQLVGGNVKPYVSGLDELPGKS